MLRLLDLSGCGMGDEGAYVLRGALTGHPTMRTLDLSRNRIGITGGQVCTKQGYPVYTGQTPRRFVEEEDGSSRPPAVVAAKAAATAAIATTAPSAAVTAAPSAMPRLFIGSSGDGSTSVRSTATVVHPMLHGVYTSRSDAP